MMGSGINVELPWVGFIGRHLPIPVLQTMFRASDHLSNYGRRAIANSRAMSSAHRNIFSGLMYEAEKDDATLDDEDVASEAGNLIVAGSDTTAITLTYLVWAVLCHPRWREALEKEVDGVNDDFDDARLEELPVLNAIIKEALRLYGAAPGSLPRAVPKGGATLSEYFIPEGVTVSTQSYTIHRDEALYADPETFDPTRWLHENKRVLDAGQAAFSPFGAGSRTCLGIHLAWMELRLATAEFFRRCRGVKLGPGVDWERMKPENYFLISPRGHYCEILQDGHA